MALVTGCKGFWNALPSNGGGGTASGVFYVLNSSKEQVAGFSFATNATSATAVTGGSVTLAAAPLSIAIDPKGSYLYVGTGGGIVVYSIGSGGVLNALNNGDVISSNLPTAMAVDGTGAWLLESIGGSGLLSAIPVSSGLVDTTRSVQTVTLPHTSLNGIAVSPANSTSPYVFAAMGIYGIAAIPFTASATTTTPFGTVSNPITPKNTGGADVAVAVDPTNPLVYVAETVVFTTGTNTGGLRVFTIGSTKVTEVSGSPYQSGGTGPSAILPTGNFVYVANLAGSIDEYPITDTAGAYSLGTNIGTATAGDNTVGLAEDGTGKYVLAVNSGGSPDVSVFTFDTTTSGKLDTFASVTTGSDPVQASAIVAVPPS